ncbi:site-specific tyrosine recombinase XerD [Fulvivirga kasyanovii]|uniref:Recombinase XerD n=1 Tax=Fulvivirga kasyanovii TaxID=396812 RepID=A0ABW9RKK7_9BACT|nr:tyrosine-type recombinase/integrase [Fulvivirga kasyanovii]MTI24206.1 recombinase XerD [Fulvivirga kasyanovii]
MKYNSITPGEARGVKAKPSYTYQRILAGYKEWLDIIGYSKSTVKRFPLRMEPFILHLKKENISSLDNVPYATIRSYYEDLKHHRSEHTGEFLNPSTLNGYIRNLNLFNKYLQETDQGSLQLDIKREKVQTPEAEVLAKEEIHQLYGACSEQLHGLKERAILSLYYGCGLRCGEGVRLNLNDVMLDKQMVYVRQSKTGRARYVPFVESQKKDFELYLKHYRPHLESPSMKGKATAPFLLNQISQRMSNDNVTKTLKDLIARTENEDLQSRKITPHTLRHSIATHLLRSGMELEAISQFLGHRWLSSTQIYLHLSAEV